MTVKFSSITVDLEKERNGDWVSYPEWPGAEFNVNSVESPAFKEARDKLMRRLARRYGDKPIPSDGLTKDLGDLYAKHLLNGWKGFDMAYSADAAREALCDPAYRLLTEAVLWCAQRVGRAQVEFLEEAAGN